MRVPVQAPALVRNHRGGVMPSQYEGGDGGEGDESTEEENGEGGEESGNEAESSVESD